MPGLLPIVYVGDCAGRVSHSGGVVDDTLDGFAAASTQVRIGGAGAPAIHRFEGPLRRLVDELGYRLHDVGEREPRLGTQAGGAVSAASVWVHRPDRSAGAGAPGRPRSFSVEAAAEDLLRLVEEVRAESGAPRVHLVAYATGGLICRSMIQRVVPDRYGPGSGVRARDLVARLFTYGTPHGGMGVHVVSGLPEAVRDGWGTADSDVFGRERMYEYLTPSAQRQPRVPDAWDPQVNPDEDNFPGERIFCLVGTDATGQAASHCRSARAVDVLTDGLVPVRNAVVHDSDHAFVHRSHSGRHGLVNSEAGYHTLVRFLFGDVRLTADLVHLRLPRAEGLAWQAETRASIRGLAVPLHERTAAHHCPILVDESGTADPADRSIPLVTSYLWSRAAGRRTRMRCAVHVRLVSVRHENGSFSWDDHIEGSADFDDQLVIDVEQLPGDQLVAWATWGSDIAVPLHAHQAVGEPLPGLGKGSGSFRAEIRLPRSGAFLGDRAALALSVQPTE